MQEIIELIGNNGFAIVAAVWVFTTMTATNKENRERTDRLNEQHAQQIERINAMHRDEMAVLTDQLAKITSTLGELCIYIKEGHTND